MERDRVVKHWFMVAGASLALFATASAASGQEVELRQAFDHFARAFEQAAARVEAEVLNVVGRRDHMVTPGPALDFAELVGAGSLELESDCGHLAPGCETERLEDVVRRFLAR